MFILIKATKAIAWFNSYLCKLLSYLIGFILAAISTILFVSVISRYFFNNPLTWSEDILNILMIWMVLLGAALGLREGTHVAIDLIIEKFPGLVRKIIDVIIILIIGFVAWIIFKYGWAFAMKGMRRIVPSIDWLKFGYVYLALPTGYGLILLVTVEKLLEAVIQLSSKGDE